MATPVYLGTTQPASAGFLSCLGSLFGDQTPAYAGAGQPTSSSSGLFCSATPAYRTCAAPQVAPSCRQAEQVTIVIPRELIESQSQQ